MSWRDADDPRCPECGEKIAVTAYYCMHCHADLPGDVEGANQTTSGDEVLADDEYTGGWEESESTTDSERGQSLGSQIGESVDTSISDSLDELRGGDRHRIEGFAGRIVSLLGTDVPDPDGVPRDRFTTSLWFRLPVALVVGTFVFAAFGGLSEYVLGDLLGPLEGTAYLVAFIFIVGLLARKPLVSDIIGDGCYAIALLVLLLPPAFVLNGIRALLFAPEAAENTLSELLMFGVVMEIFVLFPAGVLFAVGYVGNRYARSKLDSAVEDATTQTA